MKPILVAWIMIVGLGAGCAPKFKAPEEQAPHALVEFRALYHSESDDFLTQTVEVDGLLVSMSVPSRVKGAKVVKAVRIAAGSSQWHVRSELSHGDTVRRYGPETVRETPNCPAGLAGCGAPKVVSRDEWATDVVTDARCEAELKLETQVGRSYELQYDFYGPGKCTLALVGQR